MVNLTNQQNRKTSHLHQHVSVAAASFSRPACLYLLCVCSIKAINLSYTWNSITSNKFDKCIASVYLAAGFADAGVAYLVSDFNETFYPNKNPSVHFRTEKETLKSCTLKLADRERKENMCSCTLYSVHCKSRANTHTRPSNCRILDKQIYPAWKQK